MRSWDGHVRTGRTGHTARRQTGDGSLGHGSRGLGNGVHVSRRSKPLSFLLVIQALLISTGAAILVSAGLILIQRRQARDLGGMAVIQAHIPLAIGSQQLRARDLEGLATGSARGPVVEVREGAFKHVDVGLRIAAAGTASVEKLVGDGNDEVHAPRFKGVAAVVAAVSDGTGRRVAHMVSCLHPRWVAAALFALHRGFPG